MNDNLDTRIAPVEQAGWQGYWYRGNRSLRGGKQPKRQQDDSRPPVLFLDALRKSMASLIWPLWGGDFSEVVVRYAMLCNPVFSTYVIYEGGRARTSARGLSAALLSWSKKSSAFPLSCPRKTLSERSSLRNQADRRRGRSGSRQVAGVYPR